MGTMDFPPIWGEIALERAALTLSMSTTVSAAASLLESAGLLMMSASDGGLFARAALMAPMSTISVSTALAAAEEKPAARDAALPIKASRRLICDCLPAGTSALAWNAAGETKSNKCRMEAGLVIIVWPVGFSLGGRLTMRCGQLAIAADTSSRSLLFRDDLAILCHRQSVLTNERYRLIGGRQNWTHSTHMTSPSLDDGRTPGSSSTSFASVCVF
jgi:hypothetical protein